MKDFVTYEQALALKELEFNGPCLADYTDGKLTNGNYTIKENLMYEVDYSKMNIELLAPTYSQAFGFFRDRFKLSSHTDLASISHLGENYYYQIQNFADFISPESTFKVDGFKTQEEAESACLDKLIQFLS